MKWLNMHTLTHCMQLSLQRLGGYEVRTTGSHLIKDSIWVFLSINTSFPLFGGVRRNLSPDLGFTVKKNKTKKLFWWVFKIIGSSYRNNSKKDKPLQEPSSVLCLTPVDPYPVTTYVNESIYLGWFKITLAKLRNFPNSQISLSLCLTEKYLDQTK